MYVEGGGVSLRDRALASTLKTLGLIQVGMLKHLRTVRRTFWKLQSGFRGLNRQMLSLALGATTSGRAVLRGHSTEGEDPTLLWSS